MPRKLKQRTNRKKYTYRQQEGTGIMDKIRDAVEMTKSGAAKGAAGLALAQMAGQVYTGSMGTAFRNLVPSADANARGQFPGEKHAIQRLPNGYFGTANFTGPGTQIEKRIARGDQPRSLTDKVSMAHDLRYSLANGDAGLMRKSDLIMVNSLKKIRKNKTGSRFNTIPAQKGIEAKMKLEDAGFTSPNTFINVGAKIKSPKTLKARLKLLHQEGYGLLPGDHLKLEALKMVRKANKTKKNSTAKGAGFKRAGEGFKLAGSGLSSVSIASFVAGKLLPNLMRQIKKVAGMGGRGITKSIATKVKKAIVAKGGKTLKSIAAHSSAVILPLLFKAYGAQKSNVTKLTKSLKGVILSKLKDFAGGLMSGSGFWSDFGKGFVKGFTGAAKIGIPVAKLLL